MKVVCDNCGAVYKIPEHKLVKEVNKATCRKCGHRIMIRRKRPEPVVSEHEAEEATVIAQSSDVVAAAQPAPVLEHPPFGQALEEPTPLPTSPMDHPTPLPAMRQSSPTPQPTPHPLAAPSYPAPQPTTPQAYPSARTPARSPAATGVPLTERSHDPSGDLSVVTLGVITAVIGALLLAMASGGWIISFVGLLLALWGSFVALLVLITGGWGRRPAWIFLSLFTALFLSTVFSAVLTLPLVQLISGSVDMADITSLAQRVSDATQQPDPQPITPPPPAADAVAMADPESELAGLPEEPPEDQPEEGSDDPKDLLDVIAADDIEPKPEPEPEPAPSTSSSRSGSSSSGSSSRSGSSSSGSSSRSGSSSSGSSSRSGSSSSSSSSRQPTSSSSSSSRQPTSSSSSSSSSRQPTSSSSSSSSSRQPTSSSSSSSGQKTIPTTVIDIQIRNNKNVKACFLAHKKTTGELPSVTLKFTLEPDGAVSSASIREAVYQGTALESCLSGSIKMIDFQSFDGPAYTLNYPFRF